MLKRLCEKSKQVTREPWHRYRLPGYDSNDGFPEYRFQWELFGEAVFYTSVDISIEPIILSYFSRAILSDIDLLSLSGETPTQTPLSSSTDPVLDVSESEVKDGGGDCDTDEDIAQEMAALDLPASFGGSNRKGRSYRYKRKQRNFYIRDKSPNHQCLSEYLFRNAMYLERKSWFHDYPESFSTTQEAENFNKYTDRNCAPYALLKEHKQASAFFGASYSKLDHREEQCSGCWFHSKDTSIKDQTNENNINQEMGDSAKHDDSVGSQDRKQTADSLFKTNYDWNALYLMHKEVVESRIRDDYEKYTKESNKRRCLEFPDKAFGLTYKRKSSSSDDDDDLETSVSGLRRQRDFHIADIHYDLQIPSQFIQKKRRIRPHTSEVGCGTNVGAVENVSQLSDFVLKDFDFGYDDKRDRWLLAKNALKTFVDDKEMPKYYNQRFRLFSKLNEGILMDREGWYSVTPERIAAHTADRVVIMKDAIVLDGFAGVGGNCIQFALKGAYVIALDMDPVRLRCARRNAEIYGVADRINFICIDFFNFCKFHCDKVKHLKMGVRQKQSDTLQCRGCDAAKLWKEEIEKNISGKPEQIQRAKDSDGFGAMRKPKTGRPEIKKAMHFETDTDDEDDLGIAVDNCNYMPLFDAALLSPPWGGPSYLKSMLFSLKDMELKGDKIFRVTRKLTHNIAYFLPRQTDVKELIRLSKDTGGMVEIEQAEINRKVKAITAYYGELACSTSR
ncbi:unnamed protein product [Litomosoides sigmodontis]|uniref:Trimethylguanosine synthase n=1 Tax=Litomosoides sigmodontis TaxID=42156 RepID=A0A3P6UW82_LITSI|nr:unnamed protein product [Litomosoides sigmodontis]